ncbi:hypothetical protein BDQ12DRAFT_702212 [Crucibulum laeve]|uniref:DUF221-domain-containing protein n=1 Tax=Crucibulum laeve TaxID=68775 RepID=A0A5C3MJ18_9AGAR|nr:hypothetical protein BDQ12DRAFT_702212 [Crucibulum laeve]
MTSSPALAGRIEIDTNGIKDVFAAGRKLQPASVGTQVLLMTAISVVTVLAFNMLRPKNKIIYEPKVKYHLGNKAPPRISSSFFGWLPPVLFTKEPELLDKVGLDAVAFLRFLRLMRWLFTLTALLACGVLIPVNYLYTISHRPKYFDILSAMTIKDVKGVRLYTHVAITYIITIFVVVLVYFHWCAMLRLRKEWFASPEYIQSFYGRTLSIRHVPRKYQSDEGLRAIMDGTHMPYPATSVHIGRKVGKLPDLIEYHNNTVKELEEILVKYLKGGKIGKHRPTIRIGGCCGLGGMKKDAIDFYTAKLRRTEAAVLEYRAQIDTRRPENYGFASLAAIPYAHIAAQKFVGKHPKGTRIELAPNPRDIIWTNISKSSSSLFGKKIIGFFWLGLICFLSLIPLFPVATLANLDAITATGYIPFLQQWADDSKITYSIVDGVLPPAVSALFTFFLPRIMRWLSKYMGAQTHTRLDRAVVARYFAFLVISQLIVFTLIGVVFNSVLEIVTAIQHHKANATTILKNLNKLTGSITRTYVSQSSFWLKWFPMRGFLVFFDLAQVFNLIWISIKTRIFGRTPRDIREWTKPPTFEYAIYYSNLLFMAAVGLLFAPLAPLVVLAAAIVFWLSSWVYKYQLMFVFVTKVESGGRLWNVVINRLLVSVMLMQALMILTIGLQYKFKSLQWLSTVPPLLIIIIFKIFLKRKFDNDFRYYTPSEEDVSRAIVHSERADARAHKLEQRFGHPALHADLFTPMVHAKMMPLLKEVYQGRIHEDLQRSGGMRSGIEKPMAQDLKTSEGIKFAAVEQNELEYDPVLYQRDRGELDWDTASMASSSELKNNSRLSYGPGIRESYISSGPYSPGPPTAATYATMDSSQHLMQPSGYFDTQTPTNLVQPTLPYPPTHNSSSSFNPYTPDSSYPPPTHHQHHQSGFSA